MAPPRKETTTDGPVDLEAPGAARWIVRTLEEAGHEAWAVGGAVRDALAGRPTEDWDFTTSAHPGTVRKLFRRTVPIGLDHGTVGVLARDGTLYEVTTYRRDVETTGRHAVVEFADSVEEDLARRDFTINALAWHPVRKELNDPFHGREDLRRGVLRTVGEPAERFREDYLRVLRALRFSGAFALEVERGTWEALVELAPGIRRLSAERIREELEKVLGGAEPPSRSLSLYAASGCLPVAFGELEGLEGFPRVGEGRGSPDAQEDGAPAGGPADDAWSHALRTVDLIPPAHPHLRLAALLRAAAVPAGGHRPGDAAGAGRPLPIRGGLRAAALMERLRFSNAYVRRVAETVEASLHPVPEDPGGPAVRRWMRTVGRERLRATLRLLLASARAAEAREPGAANLSRLVRLRGAVAGELRSGCPLAVKELVVGGRELKALGMRPGPHFKEILGHLLDRVLEDPGLHRRDELVRMAEEYARERGFLEEDPRAARGEGS